MTQADHISIVKELEKQINSLADENEKLRNQNASLRYEARVATIGHDQLNKYIGIFDSIGFRGHHIGTQVEMVADEIRKLRSLSEGAA